MLYNSPELLLTTVSDTDNHHKGVNKEAEGGGPGRLEDGSKVIYDSAVPRLARAERRVRSFLGAQVPSQCDGGEAQRGLKESKENATRICEFVSIRDVTRPPSGITAAHGVAWPSRNSEAATRSTARVGGSREGVSKLTRTGREC